MKRWFEVFWVSTKLGLTSFGGPVAHLGYFHNEYVRRRKWMDEHSYADLVALCQFLPGPASSQVGMGIGIIRSGFMGGLFAFLGFTLPSVIALMLFATLLQGMDVSHSGWIHGLKLVAVAIVAHAILGMGQKLTPDRSRITIAVMTAAVTLIWQTALTQVLLIVFAGLLGLVVFKNIQISDVKSIHIPIRKSVAIFCIIIFLLLLIVLPIVSQIVAIHELALFDSFYRAGSLVFGGGHVVLPLLEREVVPTGWIDAEQFLAGYGAAQAVPGPLFTFASYLGTVMDGWKGGVIATIAIFLPAFLLIVGMLPFWSILRRSPKIQGVLTGVNAAVVGILLAALYDPLWTSAVHSVYDFSLVMILFVMLIFWKFPPWSVVIAGALGGMMISFI